MRAIYAKADINPGFGSDKDLIGDEMKALGKLPLAHNPGERWTLGSVILAEYSSGEATNRRGFNAGTLAKLWSELLLPS